MLDPYAYGALQKEHHDRLVADLDTYAADAGIQPHWIYTPLSSEFTAKELDYIRRFRRLPVDGTCAGICYVGKTSPVEMELRLAALAGCLVRNFVRARLMTLGQVLDAQHDLLSSQLTALLIPNFFLSSVEGGHLATWQVSALYDLLLSRFTGGQQTIIHVSDEKALSREYGTAFTRLINDSFLKVQL